MERLEQPGTGRGTEPSSAAVRTAALRLGRALLAFALLGLPAVLEAQAPRETTGPLPEVRLGDQSVAYPQGTVEVPIYVRNEAQADGLLVSIDYDEVFLGYAWYRASNEDWRVEGVTPYGPSRVSLLLRRNGERRPVPADDSAEEHLALHAVFYLKRDEDARSLFQQTTAVSLGAVSSTGSLDSYFFLVGAGGDTQRRLRTRASNGTVSIYYRDGVEIGSVGVTQLPQDFTLPVYLTYLGGEVAGGLAGVAEDKNGVRIFTVGIDYDEVFLGLVGAHGLAPPLGEEDVNLNVAADGGHATFQLELPPGSVESACHLHVVDLHFHYSGDASKDDDLRVVPELVLSDAGKAGDGAGQAAAGASQPGATAGVVEVLPPYFVRGNVDSNVGMTGSGELTILGDQTDVILILEAIFLGRARLPCQDAADTNDNGKIDVSDAILLLSHLFRGGPPPAAPFPAAGPDSHEDSLGCDKPLPYSAPRSK